MFGCDHSPNPYSTPTASEAWHRHHCMTGPVGSQQPSSVASQNHGQSRPGIMDDLLQTAYTRSRFGGFLFLWTFLVFGPIASLYLANCCDIISWQMRPIWVFAGQHTPGSSSLTSGLFGNVFRAGEHFSRTLLASALKQRRPAKIATTLGSRQCWVSKMCCLNSTINWL